MKSILELLTTIRERPGLFIGRPSVEILHAYLNGFVYARRETHPQDMMWLREFANWVILRFELRE